MNTSTAAMHVDQRITELDRLRTANPQLSIDQRAEALIHAARIENLLEDEQTVLPGWQLDRLLAALAPDVTEDRRRFLFGDLREAQELVDADPYTRARRMDYDCESRRALDRAEQAACNDRDNALWHLLRPGVLWCRVCVRGRPLLAASPAVRGGLCEQHQGVA